MTICNIASINLLFKSFFIILKLNATKESLETLTFYEIKNKKMNTTVYTWIMNIF